MAFDDREPTGDSGPRARPAIIFCDARTTRLRVAALTLLDRTLIAVHRAGFGPIHVVREGSLPPLPRAEAWKIPFTQGNHPGERRAWTLVIRTTVLVQAADLRRLEDQPARLVDAAGRGLPVGLVPPGDDDPEVRLKSLPAVEASGVALLVRDDAGARAATRAWWASLKSTSDGVVDRLFNRPVGRWLSRVLIHTPVTPNVISVAATLIGLVAAGLFAVGEPGVAMAAAILFQISAIVDCVDGDVARAVFKESPLGKWLDLVGDQVVHLSIFAGIAVGLWRSGAGSEVAWLGASAIAGGLLSFLVVLRCQRSNTPNKRLQRWMDAAATRDFSVVVLVLSFAERLPWFLWMAAIGSHVFWVLLLAIQRAGNSQEVPGVSVG